MRLRRKMYKFNINYFDEIDTPDKAYWIGFIWCDGSIIKRQKTTNFVEYCLKIDLQDKDFEHLCKFKKCLNSEHPIKRYCCNSTFIKNASICRIDIYNKYFGKLLYDKYKIVPNRYDCFAIINSVPLQYSRDFIRGCLDADGSFSRYVHNGKYKYNVQFGGSKILLDYIIHILYDNHIIVNDEHKYHKRHKENDKDGNFLTVYFSGRKQFYNILEWLYKDSDIFLDRKYEKFINIKGGDKI